MELISSVLLQAALAVAYYAGLLAIVRLSGKRLAGQIATFDFVVLISMGVVLQNTMLRKGPVNAFVFVITVFVTHRGAAMACSRSRRLRALVRGAPRPLVAHGQVSFEALEQEGLTYDDLLAGLRKLGYPDPRSVLLATLEETGHISATPMERSENG